MRERLYHNRSKTAWNGITPARAGKTFWYSYAGQNKRDHPRSCGKDVTAMTDSVLYGGSPPLVRERLSWRAAKRWLPGITPARAGKTCHKVALHQLPQDHPRSCGKDSRQQRTAPAQIGSPPLVRERHKARNSLQNIWGITPARAGKTHQALEDLPASQDHPRSCGKDPCVYTVNADDPGSPPLVRERRAYYHPNEDTLRITPARAGKTEGTDWIIRKSWDHPRSCGKDILSNLFVLEVWGSPPLVRERHSDYVDELFLLGITPARAGKTVCKLR